MSILATNFLLCSWGMAVGDLPKTFLELDSLMLEEVRMNRIFIQRLASQGIFQKMLYLYRRHYMGHLETA